MSVVIHAHISINFLSKLVHSFEIVGVGVGAAVAHDLDFEKWSRERDRACGGTLG